jgi:hypothetical protein
VREATGLESAGEHMAAVCSAIISRDALDGDAERGQRVLEEELSSAGRSSTSSGVSFGQNDFWLARA